mgnify:CR=1 FL=1
MIMSASASHFLRTASKALPTFNIRGYGFRIVVMGRSVSGHVQRHAMRAECSSPSAHLPSPFESLTVMVRFRLSHISRLSASAPHVIKGDEQNENIEANFSPQPAAPTTCCTQTDANHKSKNSTFPNEPKDKPGKAESAVFAPRRGTLLFVIS